jgi:hypothetical protein
MVVRSIGVWSLAKLSGALYAAMGLILGLIFACISLVGAGIAASDPDTPAWLGAVFGVGAVVFLPLLYGFFGFIGGAIGGALYNLFSGMVGGVELAVE